MALYFLRDGGRIKSESPQEFVTQLRTGSFFDESPTNQEYMVGFSEREKMYSGATIRTDNETIFFEDLSKTNYIEKIEP